MSGQLAFDARMSRSGIGVYTSNLLRELHDGYQWPVHALTHRESQFALAPYCERITVVDAPIYTLQEQFAVARAVRRDRVLHVPHYNVPVLYRGTLLATIHDLTHLLDQNYRKSWKSRLYANPMLAYCGRRAAHIFTVSEYSKLQIVEHLGVAPDKISVVYNGVGQDFHPGNVEESRSAIAARFGVETPYLLYVGNLKPHKNVEALLEAYAEIFRDRPHDCAVVLAGADLAGEERLRMLAARLHISPLFISDANAEEIAHLYRAAEALVQPSFEEGFGLPVIEAMACGTPVVCSNAASLPEIAGDAVLFFDPRDRHQLVEALNTLLSSTSLQLSLRAKGIARAARYTWRETANRHVEVYRRFCG
jgi:glycosyltransferase involved in cell wall biosynthesis